MSSQGDAMAENTLFTRVGAKLSQLLEDEVKPGSRTASEAKPVVRLVLQEEFEEHLRGLVGKDAKPLAGKVNFIGLSKIKEKLGDRWPRLAERADEITRKAIERRLMPADVYTRYKELHYLIIFASLTEDQAKLKCALIAEEITKRLLGDEIAPEDLEVKTMVSHIQGKFAFEDIPSVEVLAAQFSEDGTKAGGGAAPADQAQTDESWWDDEETSDPLAQVQLVYRPMWDVKRSAITTFVCAPAQTCPAGRLLVGEGGIPRLNEPSVAIRLDQLVQKRVIGDLRRLDAAGQPLLLCLPVHFETLAVSQRRMAYIERCQRGIPSRATKRIVFELTGVPAGIPHNRLFEMATALKGFSRGVLLRTTLGHSLFRPASETGVAALGIEHNSTAGQSEARIIAEMARFCAAAKKVGLATYVHGLRTISLSTGAIAAGFDFVDGETITSVVDSPRGAYAYKIQDLFAAQLGSPTA